MAEVILETKKISKSFIKPGGLGITVLENIDLKVKEGEFVCVLGPSGAGKSTLMRVLTGLASPTSGELLYHNVPINEAKPKIAMVFQSFALFPWLTVLENVELVLKPLGVPQDEGRAKAVKMLDLVGLDGFEEAYPREISGGMQQRAGLARALAPEPEILFMDEPFSALDVLTADNLRKELMHMWTNRQIPIKSIICVTHNIEEAVFLADRAVIMASNPGRIKTEYPIGLPYPRDKNAKEFKYVLDRIFTLLTKPVEEVPFLTRGERYQFLPHTRVGAIAGLLQLVLGKGGRTDIHVLSTEIVFEVDDIFPIMEAAVFLGFGRIAEGDFLITESGKMFSQSNTLKRKEIFREVALGNIQLIKQIMQLLNSSPEHRVAEDFILELLLNHFTEGEAENQLKTAIDWGRYAELFAYDLDTGDLYLETETPA